MITNILTTINKEFAPSLIHPSACRDLKIVGLQTGGIAQSLGSHPLPAPLRALLSLVATLREEGEFPPVRLKWLITQSTCTILL